jgi:formylglycine-generating enzyme required for sulfatase activity/serine/threonine protein kinase
LVTILPLEVVLIIAAVDNEERKRMKSCWNCKQEVAEGSSNCPHCRVLLSESAVNMMATVGPGLAPSVQIVVGVVVNNRYEIRREIGRGGMGIVYLAFDRMMEREVAIKVIPQELCMDPRAVAELKRETGIAIDLTHANIVRLYTLDTWEGQAYVVMEYVGGGTLAHVLAKGVLSVEGALPILRQLAAALDYSHSAASSVVHRDLKPLNILLAEDGATVKVADFGLARVLRDSASRISGHDSAGTLAYMAPEQIRGKGIGRETDIYAFAAIVYEMLSGRPPFYTGDLRWQILHEEVEPIEGLPAHVNAALQRGLAKEREERPGTAGELLTMLVDEKLQVVSPKKKATVKKPATNASGKGRGLGRTATGLLIVILMVGLGALGWKYFDADVQQLLRGGPILSITSEPAGAMVYVDEGKVNPTPTAVMDLPNGTHTVRLEKERYQSYSEKVFIQQGQPLQLQATLVPEPFGDITIQSQPPGAVILVDKKELGHTPATLTKLAQGNHQLQLQKEGFDPWERQVEIRALQLAEIQAALVSAFGGIMVTSKPEGATVFVDGKMLGVTPFTGEAPKGKRLVELKKETYLDGRQEVEISAGQPVNVHADLELGMGTLKITSEPSGASVKIDGKDVGVTPVEVEHLHGLVNVELAAAMYQIIKKQAQIQAGEVTTVTAQLQLESGFTDPTTGMEFVAVPGGCFQMGDTFGDGGADEKPVHEVCVDGFFLGKYEVTQGEYQKIVGTNPSNFKKGDRYPVENVSWEDAREFIKKLNSKSKRQYRLPTEAEWEYAARSGGKKEKYAGGNDIDAMAWYSKNSGSSTHPVGGKRPNGLGLYDMSGNVWEWCQDWFDANYYSSSPRQNPAGPSSGSIRVLRGGSWNGSPANVRAAFRNGFQPWERYGGLGFRVLAPRTAER